MFLDLTGEVRANELGDVFCALHRVGNDSQVYKVMEQCESAEAIDGHGKTDYFCEASIQLARLLAGAPDMAILEAITR